MFLESFSFAPKMFKQHFSNIQTLTKRVFTATFQAKPVVIKVITERNNTWYGYPDLPEVVAYKKLVTIPALSNQVPKFYRFLDAREYDKNWLTDFDATGYLVLERVQGKTLAESDLKQHIDAIDAAVKLFSAHNLDHGDLSRHNILIRPDNSICLVDFEFTRELPYKPDYTKDYLARLLAKY